MQTTPTKKSCLAKEEEEEEKLIMSRESISASLKVECKVITDGSPQAGLVLNLRIA
jgi:hypothetical protein